MRIMPRDYKPQVQSDHYAQHDYLTDDRWASYWHQVSTILHQGNRTVLEIGIGNRIVTDVLTRLGLQVTTLDISLDVSPDLVGTITSLPFPVDTFDVVLAAEVLEHIAWEDVPTALAELRRVSRRPVLISVPNAGYTFACEWKFPLLRRQRWVWRLPLFWRRHAFDGQHYWELGKRGFSRRKFRDVLRSSGFRIVTARRWPDDPNHDYFLIEADQ
jgi:ubiquinone/menaquinone biosynthesis C-methylase UbiE